MRLLQNGYLTGPLLGALWVLTISATVAVAMSFATGDAFRPSVLLSLLSGLAAGAVALFGRLPQIAAALALAAAGFAGAGPMATGDISVLSALVGHSSVAAFSMLGLALILKGAHPGALSRHEFEEAVIRFLTGFGYIFFTAIVLIPFYVMVMTSLKNQSELLQNPLDFTLDFSKGFGLLRSYQELFQDFNFGTYLINSFGISVMTVFITLAFSVPGAYAVARLRFRGRAAFSRSILLIYMVPMIVLALPIYIAFSMTGLRNSLFGIVLIYPVTTIPVALYMLQGYFRGLPAEIEEAGLMDGLSRLAVIWKITLPLALPALASVSLYVFMIAWNEFLLAFMLLDDPSKFTLTRGIASLNSSEIPRQHLMAGAVIATVPIMALFLGLERFMTKGLTAGSVKG
ncbi:carbohydrate ABC transporter permease [Roseibium denhamense]|uniref:Carbohydrate ABC transporter membrane protein 2, CUT1 family n=1 Tax=Roseibium denhamense TaxID=76305 RepID=A0ABY1NGC5_9HYPH|nr:carbohydrate ABC transporter permease [Roseibium denhamense]MTI06376.1 carbohydrate ABC transporter permease [Roseibium denhamense]SMP08669.1 carbohydrate ABC transporter membrane protein 2, CUT1 family [Roseibium denhamense]